MNVRNALAIVGIINVFGALTVQASTTLPYAQSFEGSWVPGDPITNTLGGIVAASPDAEMTGAGTQGLIVSNATVTLDVNDVTASNAWIQIYAKPVKGSSSPTVSGVNGAFYIATGGQLMAWSGGAWTNVGAATKFNNDQHYGFIIHADYVNDKWDIYYTTGAYKAPMERLNATPLLFSSTGAQIDSVSVDSGDKAFIDALAVSRGFTDVGLTGDRVAVYEHATNSTALADFTLPAYSSSYTNPPGANALGARLGNDILSGLIDGDKIKVWDPNSGAFQSYGVNGAQFDTSSPEDAVNKNSMLVDVTTRMMLDPTNTLRQTFGFYPHNSNTVLAISGVAQSGLDGVTNEVTLNGTLITGGSGFTPLTWVDSDTLATIEIRDNAAALELRDTMYVSSPTYPNSFTEYWWDNAGNWRDGSGNIASRTVDPGSKIWVKRQTAADALINVPHN